MTVDVSLDLETWGLTPGSDIRSIGAIVFDQKTGLIGKACGYCGGSKLTGLPGNACENCMNTGEDNRGSFYTACDNPVAGLRFKLDSVELAATELYFKYPLMRDPETIAWWSKQSEESQAAFADPVDLRRALEGFTAFLCNLSPEEPDEYVDVRIWCNDPHFDISIIEAAYRACKLVIPWGHRAPRSVNTRCEDAGMTREERKSFETGVKHHALDDARSQAAMVIEAARRISKWREAAERYESVSK